MKLTPKQSEHLGVTRKRENALKTKTTRIKQDIETLKEWIHELNEDGKSVPRHILRQLITKRGQLRDLT